VSTSDKPAPVAGQADIALLIPVYNRQSLLDQTLAALAEDISMDVVVVDDGSEPPIAIRPGLTRKKVMVIRLDRNGGIARALNAGLEHILRHGYEFVARLDAGDVPVEGRFTKQIEFLRAHPDHAVVGTRAACIGEVPDRRRALPRPTEWPAVRRQLHLRNSVAHPTAMYRASAVRVVGAYGLYPSVEDYEYWLRLSRRFKLANLPEILTYLDRDPDSLSIRNRKRDERYLMLVQLKHFDPRFWESYVGLLRSFVLWITPIRIVAIAGRIRRWVLRRLDAHSPR